MTYSGYDTARLAHDLADLPLQILGRLRISRVMRLPAPPRTPTTVGRPRHHGPELRLPDESTWPQPAHHTRTETRRYGTAQAVAFNRVHPRLTRRAAWIDHTAPLPILGCTLIRLTVDRVLSGQNPKPIWLWCSTPDLSTAHVDLLWQAPPQAFRPRTQILAAQTDPRLEPAPATRPERRRHLDLAYYRAHTRLRLARNLVDDLRRPWEIPADPTRTNRLSPARVRRAFRNLRPQTSHPAQASKPRPTRPRPPTRQPRPTPGTHHDVGKTIHRARTQAELQKPEG